MAAYNPNNPDVAGSEWYGSRAVRSAISSTFGRGPIIVSTAADAIAHIYATLWGTSGVQDFVTCDVYDLADPLVDAEEVILCRPGANFGLPNEPGWSKRTSGSIATYDSTAYVNVRDVVGTQDSIATGHDTMLIYSSFTPASGGSARIMFTGDNAAFYSATTGASGETVTGKRTAVVQVTCIASNTTPGPITFNGYLNLGGTPYGSQSGPVVIPAGAPDTRFTFSWYYNPQTGFPWVQSERTLLTNGTDGFGIGVSSKGQLGWLAVTTVTLQLRMRTERRVASAQTYGPPIGTGRLNQFDVVSVVDRTGASWSKLSGHTYLFVYSVPRGYEGVSVAGIDTALVSGHESDALGGTTSGQISLGPGAVPIDDDLAATTLATNTLLVDASFVAQPDSNAYGDALEGRCGPDGFSPWNQRVSSESAQPYGSARLIIGTDSDGHGGWAQTADLVFRLRRASDNAVVGGPVNIAPADVPADGKYHTVDVHFSPFTPTAGQALIMEVSSTSPKGWRIPVLYTFPRTISAADTAAVMGAATSIGGTADMANTTTTTDVPWSISLAPPNPSGLAASAATVANRPALAHSPSSGNSPSLVPYAHLTWTATTVGSGFAYNEIQRDYGGVWGTIARVTAEASNYFNDRGGILGTVGDAHARSYRMRTVRIEGGYSDWVSFPAVSVNVADCGDLVLSSNHSDEDPLAFKDLGGSHAWEQQQTARAKIQPILGDDYPLAFYPSSTPAEAFTRKLAVSYGDSAVSPTGAVEPDRAVFDPLLDLIQDRALPYIEYADAFGKLWLTSPAVQSPGPQRDEPGGQYWANVLFTEVTATPVAAEQAVPWTP